MRLVDAARAAGVEQFVFVSFCHEDPAAECPLTDAKGTVEQHLKESGMTYTMLWPGFFMEVWLSPALGFDYPNAKATIYGSGQNEISWVALTNVAQFAIASLDNPAARNATIEAAGPEALSPLEVVKIFEEVGGREFTIEHVPEEALRAQKASAPDPLQESFATMMLALASGSAAFVVDMGETLKAFPVQLGTVREYAERALGAS